MTRELTMPALSPTMEVGLLARWLVSEGDAIKAGDIIAEVETDKATMEIEADEDGRLTEIIITEGSEDVPVGAVIAIMQNISAQSDAPERPMEIIGEIPAPADAAPPVANETQVVRSIGDAPTPSLPAPPTSAGRSVVVSRLERQLGFSLSSVSATGPDGVITLNDLITADLVPASRVEDQPPEEATANSVVAVNEPIPAHVILESGTRIPLSPMRRTIAARLTESKQTIPHFHLTVSCHLDKVLAMRARLNKVLAEDGAGKLSLNDIFLRAQALALSRTPEANVQFSDDALIMFDHVSVSVAVAVDDGVVTPVIHRADTKRLTSISQEIKQLADAAHNGALAPEAYQGGTCSLTNLGMFGVENFCAVINPPQSLILAIGSVQQKLVPSADGDGTELAKMVTCTGGFDHRAMDGVAASRFMATFQSFIEAPELMLT